MNTADFDDGNFWLIVDNKPWMKALSLAGLTLVASSYVHVLLKMVIWRNRVSSLTERLSSSRIGRSWTRLPLKWRSRRLLVFWSDLTGFHGSKRKFWNLWLKTIDLALQTVSLVQMLESGFPTTLTYSYAVLIVANAASCLVMILLGSHHSAFSEVLIDSIFDLLFAVGAPIGVLAYCYYNFDFDHELLAINVEVFSPGDFERQAQMIANPSEIFLFRTSFDSLRILSVTDFLLRIGMNLSFCYRFQRVVEVQIERKKRSVERRNLQRADSRPAVQQKLVSRVAALGFMLLG
ncbi:hypothetical protein Gpo141_00014739, partial [Globisporangium polare]